ncbi:MAG: DHHA1 domain-containing protein [Anaerolineae bacterium]
MSRAYYADSYTRQFHSRIVERTEVEGRPAVVLETTYFYPTGGGQPNDTGWIGGAEVVDVITRPSDKAVLHVLTSPADPDEVDCQIDWARRFDHMQQHTGQHVLTQAFVQTSGLHTVGFHLSSDTVTIDLDISSIAVEAIPIAEDLANAVVWENRLVRARLVSPDDAEGVRMRRLPDQLATDGLRVVEIADFDQTACGGTHVAHTGEIGLIKVVRAEKRGDKTRIEFRCGNRALADYRLKNTVVNGLTADLTVGIDELRPAVARLQEGLREAQRGLKAASARLLEADAANMLATAPRNGAVALIASVMPGRDAGELRQLAGLLTRNDDVVALLAAPGPERASLVFARSANLAADMNALLRQSLSELSSGKGGGQPTLAQGGGVASEEELAALLDRAAQSVLLG